MTNTLVLLVVIIYFILYNFDRIDDILKIEINIHVSKIICISF